MIRPNPSSSEAMVHYVLPKAGRARLLIHDVLGRRVAMLADRVEDAGPHSVIWEGRDGGGKRVAPGVYWVRLEAGGSAVVLKFVRE